MKNILKKNYVRIWLDFQHPYQEQYYWCKTVVDEFNATDNLNLKNLSQKAPLIYEQLVSDADTDGESIEEHLAEIGLEGYLQDLLQWCHERVRVQNQAG